MTVKELIEHLQTFDENAVVVVPVSDDFGDLISMCEMESEDVEPRGKYVILFDNMPYTEEEIAETLENDR